MGKFYQNFITASTLWQDKLAEISFWLNGDIWLGYLEEFPDYSLTLEELRENRRDLYAEITSGSIPGVRRVAKLQLA